MSLSFKSRLLIIGKNGQVGGELVDLCKEQGLDFVATGSGDLDITNRQAVFELFEAVKPGAVINAAAYTAVDQAEDEPEKAYAVNRDGAENLALACKKHDIPMVHISTDYVFDGSKEEPYVETDTPNPINVYGKSKLAGEEVLKATWQNHWILRVSWVFGKYGNNFVKTMLRLAKERDEISVVNDQFGAPTAASDIARVIVDNLLGGGVDYGLQHLQSEPKVSWFEFAEVVFQASQKIDQFKIVPMIKPISSSQFPVKALRPQNSKLNAIKSNFLQVDWKNTLNSTVVAIKKESI